MAKLPPTCAAGSTRSAVKLRILWRFVPRLACGAPPCGRECGRNRRYICRCGENCEIRTCTAEKRELATKMRKLIQQKTPPFQEAAHRTQRNDRDCCA